MARAVTTRTKIGWTIAAWAVALLIFFPILYTLITSLQTLLFGPDLASGALRSLAALQANGDHTDVDAEPVTRARVARARVPMTAAWSGEPCGSVLSAALSCWRPSFRCSPCRLSAIAPGTRPSPRARNARS